MFRLAFEDKYRVFLARFAGVYVSEDVTDLHRVLTSFVAEHGPVHGLFDYTEVEELAHERSRLVFKHPRLKAAAQANQEVGWRPENIVQHV